MVSLIWRRPDGEKMRGAFIGGPLHRLAVDGCGVVHIGSRKITVSALLNSVVVGGYGRLVKNAAKWPQNIYINKYVIYIYNLGEI